MKSDELNKYLIYHSGGGFSLWPRITVVGEITEQAHGKVLTIAAARCSVKDKFTRKEGRELAIERLENDIIFSSISVDDNFNRSNFIEIAREVVSYLGCNPYPNKFHQFTRHYEGHFTKVPKQ